MKSKPQVDLGVPACRGQVWNRVVLIHAMVNRGESFTADTLASDLEVQRRTIERTIEFMRDQLEMPIEWNGRERRYLFTRPCPYLPAALLDGSESFLLKLLKGLVPAVAGSTVAKAFDHVLRKVSIVVGGSNALADCATPGVVFPFRAPNADECRHLQLLSDAMDQRQELNVDYLVPEAATPSARVVQPLQFGYLDQRWLVFVHDVRRGKLRTLRLDRIHGAKRTGRRFTPPAHYDVAEIVAGNLGAYTGEQSHEIRLILHGFAAKDALARPWHISQQAASRPDGSLELALRLNNLVDIEKEILKWGPQAEALSPPELRARVRASLDAARARYAR